jgi:hypothetical protein
VEDETKGEVWENLKFEKQIERLEDGSRNVMLLSLSELSETCSVVHM